MFRDDRQPGSPGEESAGQACQPEPDEISPVAGDVTRVLSQIERGDGHSAQQLLPLVYEELKKLAAAKMAQEKPGQTLQATALVHEAYLRLVDVQHAQHWNSRGHFYSAAAEAMRRILVEQARRKGRGIHGGRHQRLDLDDMQVASADEMSSRLDLIALDQALTEFAQSEPLKAQLVQLRFFGGVGNDEAAKILAISPSTAKRYWRYARAWLHARLMPEDEDRENSAGCSGVM